MKLAVSTLAMPGIVPLGVSSGALFTPDDTPNGNDRGATGDISEISIYEGRVMAGSPTRKGERLRGKASGYAERPASTGMTAPVRAPESGEQSQAIAAASSSGSRSRRSSAWPANVSCDGRS
jgi:hypothetical protein